MKLKHWIKEYRFKKANQRAMTMYWQREAFIKRLSKLGFVITIEQLYWATAPRKFPSGGLQQNTD